MSKYEVGDKATIEILGKSMTEYIVEDYTRKMIYFDTKSLDGISEPLSTYTEPLEAEIRRQAAEITRLVADNKRLKAENGNGLWNIEQARAEGQNEAWELAKKIVDDVWNGGYSEEKLKQIFGNAISQLCIVKNTYSEAAAKVAEWEKAKEEIKVGDIVKIREGNNNDLCVLCMSTDKKYYNAVDGYGAVYYMLTKEMITKTGRHIDIDSFLKQIGEE